jgi:hypothetical protein
MPDFDLVTFDEARKQGVKMARNRLRKFAINNGLAVQWGGTTEHPWLKVSLSKLKTALMSQRYVPTKRRRRERKHRPLMSVGPLHPDVRC